jgi:hypothetical protein
MGLRYFAGARFHARRELDALHGALAAAARKSRTEFGLLATVMDIRDSLLEGGNRDAEVGFLGIAHKWSRGHGYENLFVYSNMGILAAINVPGDGRSQTFDIGLIGIFRTEDEAAFLRDMHQRRIDGTYYEWSS